MEPGVKPGVTKRPSMITSRKALKMLERETGFEPATLALARRCSTTELFPPRAQAEVPQTVTVMPDQAERTAGRKLLADLAGQDRALHTGDRFSLELDPDHLTDDLLDQLVFVAEDGMPFLFKPFLLQRVPDLEVIGVGIQSRADLTAVGKLPHPQVLVLYVLQEPGGRGAVGPLPGEHGTALFQVKMDVRQSSKRLFGRDMVV